MFKDKPFQIALIFSCLTHVVIFWQNPYINNDLPKAINEIEITYIPIDKKSDFFKEEFIKIKNTPNTIEALQEKLPPPFIENPQVSKISSSLDTSIDLNPQKPQISTKAIEIKKVVQPKLDSQDKIKSPSYLNYYQAIREKIRYHAYQNYDQPEEGEVYLSFVILRNGSLKEVKIIDEKSSPSPYLKDIALKSMDESSPYTIFPKDLDYPELSFNVIISFQITD